MKTIQSRQLSKLLNIDYTDVIRLFNSVSSPDKQQPLIYKSTFKISEIKSLLIAQGRDNELSDGDPRVTPIMLNYWRARYERDAIASMVALSMGAGIALIIIITLMMRTFTCESHLKDTKCYREDALIGFDNIKHNPVPKRFEILPHNRRTS